MAEEDPIDALLSVWHERFDRGEFVPAAALCADRPELIPELERRIETLKAMATLARSLKDERDPNRNGRVGLEETKASGSTSPAGVRVPGYEVIARLGEGGMGTVYRARDERLKRLVALKVLRGGVTAAAKHFDRFLAEAEAIARLQHPHIVQVFAVGEWSPPGEANSLPYLALEYVNGGSLDKVFAAGRLEPGEAARLVKTLAHAVHAAHAAGVIHRDLKPANVLLAPAVAGNSGSLPFGFPKVADFGLARLLDADQRQTLTGAVMGTPAYMAPEQAEGRADIGPAADVWALGVILYEALTGRVPFKGDSVLTTLDLIRSCPPRPPRELRDDVPAGLEAICLRCLEKDPASRYATAAELADELSRSLAGEPAPHSRSPRRRPRSVILGGALALAGLVVLAAMTGWLGTVRRQHPPARPGSTLIPTATPAPLEATLSVRHYRQGDRPGLIWSLGELGAKTVSARVGDVARVEARFSAPAYSYLLALNPDGSVQLCEPADPRTAPVASAVRTFPTGEEDYFGFTDGQGLQAFVLVASRLPLPPFADWAAGRALSWSNLSGSGAWSYDGRRWEPRSGRDDGSRGQIVHVAGVPTPLSESCRRLAEAPGVEAVRAVAFPVQ
jgi:serine/threonine protein kinase